MKEGRRGEHNSTNNAWVITKIPSTEMCHSLADGWSGAHLLSLRFQALRTGSLSRLDEPLNQD